MDLGKRLITSIIGASIVIVGSFLNAFRSNMNKDDTLALYITDIGQIAMVICVAIIGLSIFRIGAKWIWIAGFPVLMGTGVTFQRVQDYINNFESMLSPELLNQHTYFEYGPGFFVVVVGSIIIISSVYFEVENIKKTSLTKEYSVSDELTKLSDLLSKGILTQEEFNLQKEKLLKGKEDTQKEDPTKNITLPDSNKAYNSLENLIEEFKNLGANILSQDENNVVFVISDQEIKYRRNLNKKDEEWLKR